MTNARADFEATCREQNAKRQAEVSAARRHGAPCVIVDMLAFGGVPYCTAHRIFGPCPFAQPAQVAQ